MKRETNIFTFHTTIKNNIAKIEYIFVRQDYRDSGIAKQLINDYLKKVIKKGCKYIEIDAYVEVLDFWKNLGFSINEEPQIINGHKQDFYNGILKI